jgi:hypothetical protein
MSTDAASLRARKAARFCVFFRHCSHLQRNRHDFGRLAYQATKIFLRHRYESGCGINLIMQLDWVLVVNKPVRQPVLSIVGSVAGRTQT